MPTIVDCLPGPWIVFFPRNSARLEPAAMDILDNALRVEHAGCGGATYRLTGHIDRGERAGVDRRRASAIRAYLIHGDVPRGRFWIEARGAASPRIAAPDGVHERQNQRVEITVGPPHD